VKVAKAYNYDTCQWITRWCDCTTVYIYWAVSQEPCAYILPNSAECRKEWSGCIPNQLRGSRL